MPCFGLSPRGRGNRRISLIMKPPYRSIPAWAGEPLLRGQAGPPAAVYPRVGGGTVEWWPSVGWSKGLSPRGRGNLRKPFQHSQYQRSIPAWAGEPPKTFSTLTISTVYPRVGGGTSAMLGIISSQRGLSPRGRGNRRGYRFIQGQSGSIPAWAGEPDIRCLINAVKKVYPRVGGGTGVVIASFKGNRGLSPRGRGNRTSVA